MKIGSKIKFRTFVRISNLVGVFEFPSACSVFAKKLEKIKTNGHKNIAALKHFDVDTIYRATIVFSFLAFVVPFVSLLFDIFGIQDVNIQYSLGFSGGAYGIYIILGYLVKKGYFKKYSSYKLALLAIISFIICVLVLNL